MYTWLDFIGSDMAKHTHGKMVINIFVRIIIIFFKRGLLGILLVVFFMVFSQSYVEHDLRKNKIVVPFYCQPINFFELIVMF
jgi:hypothetical protein